MPDRAFGTRPIVELGGRPIPERVAASLVGVVVESDLAAPGSCLLTFADPERSILDTIGVDFLQSVEVLASAVEETEPHSIFVGEVYGFDFMADETGAFALVRAYDAAYRLKQRRGTTSFNDVTDGDVVRQLAQDAGVEAGVIDDGDVIHPYLAQLNETHWDFLQERALASDRVLQARGGRLDFTSSTEAADAPEPGDHASTDPLQLTAGRNLVYFRVRTTASQQAEAVEARGWDPARKQPVTARASASSRGARLDLAPAEVGAMHGVKTQVAAFPGLATQATCEVAAAAAAERVAATFAYAEGQALGDPRLRAGVAVSVGRAGRFDGQYTLSMVRHVFDRAGYHTFFSVSGGHDRTLYGLSAGRAGSGRHQFSGVYPAVVTNLKDPASLGRIKVSLPWLADAYESDWARVTHVGAGPDRGLMWSPEVGDEVAVCFLAGHGVAPLVIGGLYNGADAAPFDGFADPADGQVDTRCLRTRAGHTLLFQDKAGAESIRLQTGDGSVSITLDQATGAIVVESEGDVAVNAGRNLNLSARGDLTLEASGDVTVSGVTIKLN